MQSFDTYKYIKNFQRSGFNEKQAEAIVNTLMESRDFDLSKLATKDQVENVRQELKITEERLSAKMHAIESSIIKWNIGTIIALAALFAAYLKIFGH